jgi:predicted kinase
MSEAFSQFHPRLTVVAGRPGSGKTTVAHALARAIRCPVVSRDEIKEGLVNSLTSEAAPTDAAQRHATDVFFRTLELLLGQGVTLVAEAAFQHAVWSPRLGPLLSLAPTRIIMCRVDAELAWQRHVARGLADPQRERFHPDPAMQAAREGSPLPLAPFDPPRLEVPTLVVDTMDGYRPELERIVAFARGEDEDDAATP